MKTNLILLISLLMGFSSFSQEKAGNRLNNENHVQPKTIEKVSGPVTKETRRNSTVTISKKAGQPQRTHDAAYYQEEIGKVENHISAIDTKIDIVNNDPEEKALAEANGWFTDMESIKAELLIKKDALENRLNQLDQ